VTFQNSRFAGAAEKAALLVSGFLHKQEPGSGGEHRDPGWLFRAKERGYPAVRAMCQIMPAERIARSPWQRLPGLAARRGFGNSNVAWCQGLKPLNLGP